MNAANIPAELQELQQWVVWTWAEKPNGDKTKTPLNPITLRNASSTNPADWTDYDTARLVAENTANVAGIGFVFTEEDPYVGVDFDDCLDGTTKAELRGMRPTEYGYLRLLNSYAEVSPSGTGFKVIFKGRLPDDFARRGFGKGNGIYQSGRYFTLTGDVLAPYTTINEVPEERLRAFLLSAMPAPQRGSVAWEATAERLTDTEVLALASRAQNGDKFKALYRGDWEDAGDYDSQSSADLALVELLAFYTGPAPNQIDRLFRASGLYREKWDSQRGADTYGARTIEVGLGNVTEYYTLRGSTMTENLTTYAPRVNTEEAAEVEDTPVLTREAQKKAWKRLIAEYPPLQRAELPYWLLRLVEHVAPLGRSFKEDWLEMSALGFFSALWVGKRFENLPLNLWTLGIGLQGGGKSVVADELDAIVHRVNSLVGNPMLLPFTSGTAQGLVQALEGNNRAVSAYLSEWTGFAQSMDAEYNGSMRETLLNLYDGRTITHHLATKPRVVALNPYTIINGVTTPASWAKVADMSDMGNGLYSRFLFIMPNSRPAGFVFRENTERETIARALADALEALPAFSRAMFQAGSDGPALYQDYNRDVLKLVTDEDTEFDLDDALLMEDEERLPTGRQAARVKKVGALLELLEERPHIRHDTLFVRDENVAKAIRLVQRGAAYTVRAFSMVSRSRDEMEAARVRRAVEKFGNVGIMGLLRATGLNRAEVMRSLDMLQEEGLVTSAINGGRRLYMLGGGTNA